MQLNKLKSGIKNNTDVTLKISSNVTSDTNDENNFPHKFLLTNTQNSRLLKAFANNSSVNIKSSKTQLHKIQQLRGFLGRLLGLLLKTGFPLIGNVFKWLAYRVFIPLRLTAAATATDVAIHKKMFGSGTTTLLISNVEINYIMKIVKSLEESGLSIKVANETIKNEAKEQKGEFLGMLLATLGTSWLGNLLTGKGTIRVVEGAIAKSWGQGTIRGGENF